MVSAQLISVAVVLSFVGSSYGQQSGPTAASQVPASFRTDKPRDGLTAPKLPVTNTAISAEVRGDIFMARKMYREAIDSYKSMQDTAVLLNKTGIAYHQMQDFKTAQKYYKRAIKLNHGYAEALNNLGTIHYAQRSYRRAIGQYKKALKANPEAASIWSNLGTAHFARKQYPKAMEAYEKALSLDSDVFEHRGSAGVLLQERSVAERAKFHYYQARLYAKQGMNDRALLYLRKALEEGLKERDKIQDEPEFTALKELPEFQELLAMQQRVL